MSLPEQSVALVLTTKLKTNNRKYKKTQKQDNHNLVLDKKNYANRIKNPKLQTKPKPAGTSTWCTPVRTAIYVLMILHNRGTHYSTEQF